MKILHAPDLHCYYDNYGKVLPSGEHSRLVDWKYTASYLLQAAVDNDVDIAVFPGDFFKNSRPAPEAILAVAGMLSAFSSHGIKCICIPGNHDLVGVGKPGPVDLLRAMCDDENIFFAMTPDVISLPGVNIAVLPSVKPAGLIDEVANPAELASLVSQKLVSICGSLMAQCHEYGPGAQNILIGHWTISGSVASSGQLLYGGTEPVIPVAELLGMEWDAVMFGHIHKAQVLHENPFIGYAGALERVDFGEEYDPRGCYIHDLDAGSIQWINLPARVFHTINANIKETDDIASLYGSLLHPHAEGTILRIKYRTSEELAPMVDHTKIMQLLQASEPKYIAGIFPEVERSERSREATVTEDTGPVEALSKWLDTKDIHGDIRENVLTKTSKLILEVLAE